MDDKAFPKKLFFDHDHKWIFYLTNPILQKLLNANFHYW